MLCVVGGVTLDWYYKNPIFLAKLATDECAALLCPEMSFIFVGALFCLLVLYAGAGLGEWVYTT